MKNALVETGALEKQASWNKYFEAKVYGLLGEIYFLQNNIRLVDLYFVQEKFAEATAMYDDSLINISVEFNDFYKKRRNVSYVPIKSPPENIDSVKILMEDEISVIELV